MQPRSSFWLKAALIAAAGGWAFSSSLGGGWLWDDDQYVTANPLLHSLGGLGKIWLSPPGVNYFPVMASADWLQWQAWGDHPFGYRLVNLCLHLLAALLVWRLAGKLGLREGWLAGLLFAVHPLAVESVAWISELKNVLSLPLMLLAFCAYIDFDERGERGDYARAVGWFLAAMLAKSTVALFPGVLLAYAAWKRERLRPAEGRAAAPFFAISLILGALTVWFEHSRAMAGIGSFMFEPLGGRLVGAGLALAFYAAKCVWPFGLLPIYPRWVVTPFSVGQLWPWLALAVLAGWCWMRRRTWGRHALFALVGFTAMLAPVLGVVPMAYLRLSWVADHFAYAALPAVTILAAAGIEVLAARWAAADSRLRPAALAGAMAVALVLAIQTRTYARVFASPAAMWSYTVQHNPGAWSAHNDLGGVFLAAGSIPEAMAQYREALRLNPQSVYAHFNLGNVLAQTGQLPAAIAEYQEAVRLHPEWPGFRYHLGNALGYAGRLPEAIAQFERAIQLKPDYVEAHYSLGNAFYQTNQLAGALREYETALHLEPGPAEAHDHYGILLAAAGRLAESKAQFQEALQLKPDYGEARENLQRLQAVLP